MVQGGCRDSSHRLSVPYRLPACHLRSRRQALRWIHTVGGKDLTLDDLALVAELLRAACARSSVRQLLLVRDLAGQEGAVPGLRKRGGHVRRPRAGFVLRGADGAPYLITNRHVVTGENSL